MSISIAGSTAISGLSGMDTNFDDVLEKLYSVERTQLTQLEAWKSDWQLRYDAFNQVIDQMSAAKQMMSAIGSVNHFVSKNTVSSNESVLTAIATGSAADGQHKISVSKLANNAIWCNTGKVFEEKTDIINQSGQTVQFTFDYAGKNYTYDIAPNTTLDSFVSMINNSSKNPGITVSLVNTGHGYVYQIAGKDTGEENTLTIYSCALEGMNAQGTESTWSSDNAISLSTQVSNPTKYTYTAVTNTGAKVTFSLDGNATQQELVEKLNTSAGTNVINASLDSNGNIVVENVTSLTRTEKGVTSTPSGLKLDCGNGLGNSMLGADSTETLTVTITMEDGNTRDFTIQGSATKQNFVDQVKQALQSSASLGMDSSGAYSVKLAGISGISVSGDAGTSSLSDLGFGQELYEAQGANYTPAGVVLNCGTSAFTSILGSSSTENLDVTVQMQDGSTKTFSVLGSSTREEFVNQLKSELESSAALVMDESGVYSIKLDGVSTISVAGRNLSDLGMSEQSYAAVDKSISTSLSQAKTTINFTESMLDNRIDAETDASAEGKSLRYTIEMLDGSAIYVEDLGDSSATALTSNLTNRQLLEAVKAKLTSSNVTFSEVQNDDGTETIGLEIEGVKNFFLSTGTNGSGGFSISKDQTTVLNVSSFYDTGNVDANGDPVRLLEEPPRLEYTLAPNSRSTAISISCASGTSMQNVLAQIQQALQNAGSDATMTLLDSDGNTWIDEATSGNAFVQFSNIQSLTGPGITGQVTASQNWSITNASNAVYQVDNWPMAMESSSNTITDLLEGVSITLQGVGESTLNVSTDISSVETSIQNFLDAVNSVLLTIRQLTAVDDSKEVTSNDPNDAGNSNYSKSTLTAEKGGLLTGNYGVQLVKSRFMSVLTASPPGFQSMASADDLLSGDVLSCLSNMGIKTDTDSTSETYGLLVIAPQSTFLQQMDEENYEDMINNHVNELVDFFVCEGKGTSTSADFRYNSHITGITEAGSYDVSYTVSNGEITNVTIGGQPCNRDESQGGYYFTCTAGAARGLAISIDDLTEGTHSGQVRIRQGLVQTVQNFLEKELTYNDVNITANAPESVTAAQISLKSENGAMMTLKANYANIMSNIDNSISKEQSRLDLWYNRQKNVFSNLETLLAELSSQQKSLESQLGQLSGS